MSKPIVIFFCALVFLVGCTTPPNGPEETISSTPPAVRAAGLDWTDTNVVRQPAPLPAKPVTSVIQPSPKISVPPPKPPGETMTWTWTSLNRWASRQKLDAPRFLASTPVTAYALSSPYGVMILAIGSHEVTWNGVNLQLGFEPQFIDGQIFVHGLDLQKNLEPLLCEPPLVFGTNRVIVIDPGHGGMNSGTKSVVDGRYEKEFTLDWAKRLAPLLRQDGWQVFLTRTNDVDLSLSNRVACAEAHHADVFISLHFNSAAPDTKQAGLETYCLTPTGMPSTLTRGYDDTPSQNYPDNRFDAQNLQLAVAMHRALLHASGEEDRSVRRARFIGVLRGQKRPAILIEGGYLSNAHEAVRIEDPEFQQKLAEAVAAALK